MLKIKDNVDLKELVKYGFEIKYDEDTGEPYLIYQSRWYYPFCDSVKKTFIYMKKKKKRFCFKPNRYLDRYESRFNIPRNHRNVDIFFDTLYDLIKDGLVEKV